MFVLFLGIFATSVVVSTTASSISASVDQSTGVYTVNVDSQPWYSSPPMVTVCVRGIQTQLKFVSTKPSSGRDQFGAWTGTLATYSTSATSVGLTFKLYAARPNTMVATMSFGADVNTSNCGTNQQLATQFPSFNTSAAFAPQLNTLSWRGGVMATTAAAIGLGNLGANGLDCGPVVSTNMGSDDKTTLTWSTLDSHKIIPQNTSGGVYSMGISGAIPMILSNFTYSTLFVVGTGGATSGMYTWGSVIQSYYNMSYSKRSPSVTLTDVGYYTDDGAYYYVWGGGKELNDPELSTWIPPRPWPAEKGLLLVKEALYTMGVPVAYMQLDDWWYQGPFYFGNVKSVTDWHASNSSGLFPNGLPAFSDALDLPLQLYVPFWNDKFQTKYKTFESTTFHGTKLVVPDDSYAFFSDFFDLGKSMTNGRFSTFEIDFMDSNFAGCTDCFADVGAADRWYAGLAQAALERNITLQFCLASATDMLLSLAYPSVVQARASGDYARPEGNTQPWDNVVTLGGASLLLGATAMAPSKDTLWTASPQADTSSDRTHVGYHTQPHVQLDCILATLSLGPVGISDSLNGTDAELIRQAFRSSTDSTLLRPSRPLSTVDSVWTNASAVTPPPGPNPPKAKHCTLGAYLGCFSEPKPNHFYDYDANVKSGFNPNNPKMTREVCAQLCGEYAAQNPTADGWYAAVEAGDQCRCGAVLPGSAGAKNMSTASCNSPCRADNAHMCGGDWKASVYSLQCSTEVVSEPRTFVDIAEVLRAGTISDIRATHASLGESNGPNSHYVLSWMSTDEVTMQATDLYPPPKAGTKLAIRKHVVKPTGTAQYAGCVDGQAAAPNCIEILPAGAMPTIPAVATAKQNITAYGLWSVYEPTSNGAYFLGELEKFVHVSPQRFEHVLVQGSGTCGITIRVKGTAGEVVKLVAVDVKGTTHIVKATIAASSVVDVEM